MSNGTGYYARVRAETAAASGDWSTVEGPFAPVAPPVVRTPTATPTVTPTPVDLRNSVMPVAPVSQTLTSLTGPSAVTVTDDGRIELKMSQSMVLVDGAPVEAQVNVTGNNISVQSGPVNLGISFAAPIAGASIEANTVVQGSTVHMVAEGFAPETQVVAWIQSTPTKLSESITASDGAVTDNFDIPTSIAPGEHTIQINGMNSSGKVISVIYGVHVAAMPVIVNAAGANAPWWFWPLIASLLVAFVVGYMVGRYRRQMRAR